MSPGKPTKEDALASSSTEEMMRRSGGAGRPPGYDAGGRRNAGEISGEPEHPPHRTDNAEDAPIQDNHPDGQSGEAPVRPPNAMGRDKLSTEEHSPEISDESMYDGRPEEDKDHPPSSRASS
jgi:hypothetical protein